MIELDKPNDEKNVTVEITISRAFAKQVLMHPNDHADAMIGVVMSALYAAVRD